MRNRPGLVTSESNDIEELSDALERELERGSKPATRSGSSLRLVPGVKNQTRNLQLTTHYPQIPNDPNKTTPPRTVSRELTVRAGVMNRTDIAATLLPARARLGPLSTMRRLTEHIVQTVGPRLFPPRPPTNGLA